MRVRRLCVRAQDGGGGGCGGDEAGGSSKGGGRLEGDGGGNWSDGGGLGIAAGGGGDGWEDVGCVVGCFTGCGVGCAAGALTGCRVGDGPGRRTARALVLVRQRARVNIWSRGVAPLRAVIGQHATAAVQWQKLGADCKGSSCPCSAHVLQAVVIQRQGARGPGASYRSRCAPGSRRCRTDTRGSAASRLRTRTTPACSARSGTGPAATWRSPAGTAAWLVRRPQVRQPQLPPLALRRSDATSCSHAHEQVTCAV